MLLNTVVMFTVHAFFSSAFCVKRTFWSKQIHAHTISLGFENHLVLVPKLVTFYSSFSLLADAHIITVNSNIVNPLPWNLLISSYVNNGLHGEALSAYREMVHKGVRPDDFTYPSVLKACGEKLDLDFGRETRNFKGALELLSQMRRCGIDLDPVAMIIGLGACSNIGAIKLGTVIHASAIRSCFDGFDNVRNALITMYSRCKDLRHAGILFKSIKTKRLTTWNSMLSGYTRMDRSEEASFLFREMLFSGIEPNYVTIASILPHCARVANLQRGKEFHCYILRREEFDDHLLLWNSLVEMYARSGKVLAAKRVFDSLGRRDEVTYTSLISGYGIQGEGKTALKLFDEMIKHRIKPDQVTMVAVLSACSHSGLVSEGNALFEKMSTLYGIVPAVEHFSCIVDLFGRAGLLNKAKKVITSMPYRPTTAMWATLIGACRIHGNTEIGEWAAEKLLEMKPENPGYYVLIANMHAAAGRWSKLAEVRTYMRDLGVRKAPGCTWVDVGTGFSPFVVGDTSKDNSNDLYILLEGLTDLMKDAGYVAGENFSSEDEVLEEIECCNM
ncbi:PENTATRICOPEPTIDE REPEAT-CONTAINING PROTEIN [Salix koriyanagi]|uniref:PENTATRICOPEPTIDE REPEAT-CONTAINING PROTEIN n=1 Tax=Salix koriyanagi TaxID=2511006 RepID=A0A9Q0WAK1_9ROSI|nr:PENTATRICOPEPTIDE REPEAT-CONTAINING PROTEIN [Salix koriyanagi]